MTDFTCDGEGDAEQVDLTGDGLLHRFPCPDCIGGLVPNQERLGQAGKAVAEWAGDYIEDEWSEAWEVEAGAAVRAFNKEPT